MKKRIIEIILLSGLVFNFLTSSFLTAQNNQPYLGQEPPGMTSVRFPPDSLLATSDWWWHGSPVFTPDGLEMFWTEYVKYSPTIENATLFTMKVEDNNWGTIQHPPFGITEYFENSPVLSVSGDTLYFFSMRPTGVYHMVTRTVTGWSEPVALLVPIPSGLSFGLQIAVNRHRDLYIELSPQTNPEPDIYISRYQNGMYQMAQSLGDEVNTEYAEWGPYIDPDDQYLIFSSNRPGMIGLQFDLYITFKQDDLTWTEPINMGYEVNYSGAYFPYVTLDKQFLFFNTERPGDMGYNAYWISAEIIDSLQTVVGIKEQMKSSGQLKFLRNSPNPCHTQTIITFELEKPIKISLSVYNLLGLKVIDLIRNETYQPGKHEILFDVSKLQSGSYNYTLISESGEKLSQKMLLVE